MFAGVVHQYFVVAIWAGVNVASLISSSTSHDTSGCVVLPPAEHSRLTIAFEVIFKNCLNDAFIHLKF
jgi:hypothetical protein